MRRIIFLMHVSLDGYVAGPNGEMDWIVYNDDLAQYSHSLHEQTDTAIYGRVTYQMMEGYWPTVLEDASSDENDKVHARWLEDATKVVVSRTLDKVTWKNTVMIGENLKEEMLEIKQQPGKDLWLLGSPTLAQSMMQLDLIDEYRLNINPVILGGGLPLFNNSIEIKYLKLIEAHKFEGGVVGLRYQAANKKE